MGSNLMPGADPIVEEDLIDPMLDDAEQGGDIDPVDPEPAPEPVDPEPAPVDPEPAPVDPEPAPVDPEPAPAEQLVPISRLNKEIARRKAAEERLALDPRSQSAATVPSVDDLEVDPALAQENVQQMMNLLLDNRVEDAVKLFAEIQKQTATSAARTAVKQVYQDLDQRIESTAVQTSMKSRVQSVISELKDQYDVFVESSENFDPRLVRMTLAMQRDLIDHEGYMPDQALREAAQEALQRFRPDLIQPAAAPATAPAAPKPVAPTPQAIQKKVEMAAQQPPRSGGARNHAPKAAIPDISTMTDEEFEALTAEQLARLRGDIV